jgi:hypothetical protein
MATEQQTAALLDITCPWCNAGPGQLCQTAYQPVSRRGDRPIRVSTLDAGCHDARWQAALHERAPVRANSSRLRPGRADEARRRLREPVRA